jgi:hypothetical protein
MQRYVDRGEVKISYEKTDSYAFACSIVEIPLDSQLNDVLEQDLIFNPNPVEEGKNSN